MEIKYSKKISQTAPYAFAQVDKRVAQLKEKGVEVIDFGVGDPKSPTPDFVIDAMYDAGKKRAAAGYPSYFGQPEFLKGCARYMQKNFNVVLDPQKEIESTIGSKEAVFHFPLGFIDPGDTVICPTPGYPPYKTGTIFAGGIPYFVPLLEENNFLIDLHAIPDDVAKRTKIIWTNYPNSPSGKVAPREWLEKLIQWAHTYNVIIAADEGCYIDIYFGDKPTSILEIEREGIIVFYSLSKRNNMTGYRVGFVAGDERIIDGFKKVKTNVDSGTPQFVQDAAVVALKDESHSQMMREEYKKKHRIMEEAFSRAGLLVRPSEATFYIWQKAPEGMSGAEFAEKFLEQGIVVTPGAWISWETEDGLNPGKDYVRLALVPTIEEVENAARRIQEIRF